jgi:hypothetical protein
MFTTISIISQMSQMIQTLKCDRQTGTQRSDKRTYFSFTEEKYAEKDNRRGGCGGQIGRDMCQWVNRCQVYIQAN